ncbi:MAG: nitroreductase family protein [Desulfobacula sp.]|nr:nitroreductase family protein [Desulfobacula sp.]
MFLDLIKTRRSVRKFKDKPVEKEKIDRLIEAALRSPSSRSINPWRFITVDNKKNILKLSDAKPHGAGFLKGAPLCIVVCANNDESDVWVEDTSIASIFIHLAAHDMGLGSCWIQIRQREYSSLKSAQSYVKEVLGIPDNIMVESIIAIGYPNQVKQGHKKDTLQFQKVSFNTYGLKG